jgi:hypothetical protein
MCQIWKKRYSFSEDLDRRGKKENGGEVRAFGLMNCSW